MCFYVYECVCVFELARQQTASGVPVGGGVSSPDTGCLYYSVYYWQSATQLSFDLWIGMVCIHIQMSGCLMPRQKCCVSVCVHIYFRYVCACVKK